MLFRVLRNLNFSQLFSLGKLFLKNPVYAMPTLFATKRSMEIATREYGDEHHLDNKANAFRHALWNLLIIRACLRWRNNEEKAVQWAEVITTWHEDFSPNPPLERAMDLHNNEIGRNIFSKTKNLSEEEMIAFLKQEACAAKRIFKVEDCEKYESEMVYIEA